MRNEGAGLDPPTLYPSATVAAVCVCLWWGVAQLGMYAYPLATHLREV